MALWDEFNFCSGNYKKSEFVTLMEERFNRAIRPLKLEFVDLFESNGEMKSVSKS